MGHRLQRSDDTQHSLFGLVFPAAYASVFAPSSLEVLEDAVVEPSLQDAAPDSRFQFERLGYFYVDPKDSKAGTPVFHRVVTLKDSWVKLQGKE